MKSLINMLGNTEILKLPKTAFLCSRNVPAGVILKCYDWAVQQREAGNCVISGFHSTIEKDVFHYLLKGNQPIIIALHRGIGPEITKTFATQLELGRLLIVSPFERKVMRGDKRSAAIRNRLMIDLADEIIIGHADPEGQLATLLRKTTKKTVSFISGL